MSQLPPAILVIGDVMLDRQIVGTASRISPEAPVPVVRQAQVHSTPGGAANVARNIVSLGGNAMLAGVVGSDAAGAELKQLVDGLGIMSCLPIVPNGITTEKTRIVSSGQMLLRVDHEGPPLSAFEALFTAIASVINTGCIQLVVVSDYNKGAMSAEISGTIMDCCRTRQIPVYVDCRATSAEYYQGATLLKPNLEEAVALAISYGCAHPGLAMSGLDAAGAAAQWLAKIFGNVVVTCGELGCAYASRDSEVQYHPPTTVQPMFDVCGAGDTFMAALAVAQTQSRPLPAAVSFAMSAAELAVATPGVASVQLDAVEEQLYKRGADSAKHMGLEAAANFVARRRRMGHRIGVANGCFDGLHAGHIDMLNEAATRVDTLIVLCNDDASLQALKGPTRPMVSLNARLKHLAQQPTVSAVCLFAGDVLPYLRVLKPDVLFKGGDTVAGNVPGADYVAGYGGALVLTPVHFNLSSSAIGPGPNKTGFSG